MTWEEAVRSLMEDPSQQELVSACYFDQPLIRAAERYAESPEWRAIRAIAGSPRGLASDVGAGNGIISFALAREGWNTVAVEPDTSKLVGSGAIRSLARDANLAIDVREGFGERLPVKDDVAALVIARQVLHHAQDLNGFCHEISRVLAPGGMLIAARDHVISGRHQLKPFLDNHPLHSRYGGENAFELNDYRTAIRGAGLKIQREIGSLQSVINFAPYSSETLREQIAKRLGPLGKLANKALQPVPVMNLALRFLTAIDRRPGRLVSFVCVKE